MRQEAIALSIGVMERQREVLSTLLDKVQSAKATSPDEAVLLGYHLHNLYSAIEDLFREMAAIFESPIENPNNVRPRTVKTDDHQCAHIRPRVISPQSFALLDELRAFRHVFRHSYIYELDAERVARLKEKVLTQWQEVEGDLSEFEAFLHAQLEAQQTSLAPDELTALQAPVCAEEASYQHSAHPVCQHVGRQDKAIGEARPCYEVR